MTAAASAPPPVGVSRVHGAAAPRYSICTLVTRREHYAAMRESFLAAGFTPDAAEYLYVDNSAGNRLDAYEGIRRFIRSARGEYLVLCHQDVLLTHDRRDVLERRIAELDELDPTWALLGNAGGVEGFKLALRITDPRGEQTTTPLPRRVHSLDENFIVLRMDANPGVSRDLTGFHLYGLDLCLQARLRGYTAYVVDFHLTHLSGGTRDTSFEEARRRFIERYRAALAPSYYQTTCTTLHVSGSRVLSTLLNLRAVIRWAKSLRKRRDAVAARRVRG